MNVLIIYAHPDPNSFNRAILEQIMLGLASGNHKVQVIDLYAEKFDPVLFYDETQKKRDLKNSPDLKVYQNYIRYADHLIFLYPIWWFNMPAIMKGFIDKLFASGFAYTFKGKVPKGLLHNKSAWVVYTIDAPSWFVKLYRHNIEWNLMRNIILKFCGVTHIKRVMFAGVKNSTPEKRQKWLMNIYNRACHLKQYNKKRGNT